MAHIHYLFILIVHTFTWLWKGSEFVLEIIIHTLLEFNIRKHCIRITTPSMGQSSLLQIRYRHNQLISIITTFPCFEIPLKSFLLNTLLPCSYVQHTHSTSPSHLIPYVTIVNKNTPLLLFHPSTHTRHLCDDKVFIPSFFSAQRWCKGGLTWVLWRMGVVRLLVQGGADRGEPWYKGGDCFGLVLVIVGYCFVCSCGFISKRSWPVLILLF